MSDSDNNKPENEATPGDDPQKTEDTQAQDENITPESGGDEMDMWAEAMAEQGMDEDSENADASSEQADEAKTGSDDPWAAAFAEQEATEAAQASSEETNQDTAASSVESAGGSIFQSFDEGNADVKARDLEMIMNIPVQLTVELGRTRLAIKELLELAQGSVVELDGLPGEPMDILINGYLIAQGEVVVIDDKFGIRITEIITPAERLQRLNN